jgi:enoyl-CoA hydratase/carnithine racemase
MTATNDPVLYERRGVAAVLMINRPEARNAVNGAVAAALLDGYRRFEADDDARILVLTGAGDQAFCAGADLKAIDTVRDRHEGPLGFTRLTPTKPTIAAISGWCVAGGIELALWCDLRIAAEGSTFGCFERRFGVPLIDGGTQRLPRVVGLGRALEIMMTGRPVAVDEAHRIGLVNEIVPRGQHLVRALELAETLARFPWPTLLADRAAALAGSGLPLEHGLAIEARLGRAVLEEARRGASRFAGGEGRKGVGV